MKLLNCAMFKIIYAQDLMIYIDEKQVNGL